MKNKILFFVTVVLLALFCVGCDNSVENGNGTGFVRFGEDDASRSLDIDDRLQCPVEDTYWAYTAVKVDGLHTTGESEKGGEAADTGINGTTAGGYKLRPVKNGPAAGLGVCSQEFAYGDWKFKIYGFRGYDPVNRKFTELIYTGAEVTQKVSASATALPVNFIISVADDYPETATLAFGVLSYKVPADMMLYKGTKITATFIDKTYGNKVLATAVGSVSATANAYAGTVIPLDVTLGEASAYDGGGVGFISTPESSDYTASHDISLEIVYQKGVTDEEESVTPVAPATPRVFPVVFRGGLLTVLSGDVNDIKIDDGTIKDGEFGVAVAYTGTPGEDDYVEYPTFAAAVASNKNPVVLLADINNAGVINRAVDLFPNGHVFRNAKFSGTSTLTIYKNSVYSTGSMPNTYKFWGNGSVLNSYFPSDDSGAVVNVWINTTDCDMEVNVNIGVNTYHGGSVHDIDILSCGKVANGCGYYLGADVSNELKVHLNSVYIRDVYVAKLLPQTDDGTTNVKVRASAGTRIGNFDDLFYGRTEHHGGLCQVVLKSNATGVDDIVYYVPFGMYCEIPRMIDMSRYVLPLSFTGFVDKVHLMQYRDHSFIKWTSTASATASGCISYPDGFSFYIDANTTETPVTFYAQWSNCLSFIADAPDSSVELHRDGVFTTTAPTYQYSRDGYTWNNYTMDTKIALEKLGDRVFFRGNNTTNFEDINNIRDQFKITGRVFASGTPTSLLDNGAGTAVGTMPGPLGCLFSGDANGLVVGPYIGAESVPVNGFRSLFNGCRSLEYVPKIVVGKIDNYSFFQTFRNTGLKYVDFEQTGDTPNSSGNTARYIFAYCPWLKSARFKVYPTNSNIYWNAFSNCPLLDYVRVDFASGLVNDVTRFGWWLNGTRGTTEGGTLEYFGRTNVNIESTAKATVDGGKVVPEKWTRVKITSW